MTENSNSGEYRYSPPGIPQRCATHPQCVIVRCQRLFCDQPVHLLTQRGQPRRFCSPACRVAEYRRLH
jgi:hypothetical protein